MATNLRLCGMSRVEFSVDDQPIIDVEFQSGGHGLTVAEKRAIMVGIRDLLDRVLVPRQRQHAQMEMFSGNHADAKTD